MSHQPLYIPFPYSLTLCLHLLLPCEIFAQRLDQQHSQIQQLRQQHTIRIYINTHWTPNRLQNTSKHPRQRNESNPATVHRSEELRKGYHCSTPQNHRPIGLLPTTRKVIERAIDRAIRREFTSHDIQMGFRPRLGVEMALEQTQASIKSGNNWISVLDLRTAYDRVPRDKLSYLCDEVLSPCTAIMVRPLLQPLQVSTAEDKTKTLGVVSRGVHREDHRALHCLISISTGSQRGSNTHSETQKHGWLLISTPMIHPPSKGTLGDDSCIESL